MFNLGGLEILVILVVALLVLGPDKLPGFMRTVGKTVGELRRVSNEIQQTVSLAVTENASRSQTAPSASGATQNASAAPFPYGETAGTASARKRSLPRASRTRRIRSRSGSKDDRL